jgi:CheY-like chemotaxis protein
VFSEFGKGTSFFNYIQAKRYRPADEGPRGTRRPSVSALVQDYKRRKGSIDLRSTLQRRLLSENVGNPQSPSLPQLKSNLDRNEGTDGTDVLHVLVVEDNQINQRVLAQQLERQKCVVHTADHGGEALDFLSQSTLAVESIMDEKSNPREPPPSSSKNLPLGTKKPLSIILLDIEMPVMDGLECVRRIREMEQRGSLARHVPVIAVTGTARREHVARAIDAGMVRFSIKDGFPLRDERLMHLQDAVVTKPFRIAELMSKMKECIAAVVAKKLSRSSSISDKSEI